MNLNEDVVYRCLRLGPLQQLHPGRSCRLVRHHDCFHHLPPDVWDAVIFRIHLQMGENRTAKIHGPMTFGYGTDAADSDECAPRKRRAEARSLTQPQSSLHETL
jgi:hypothetical protein